MGRRKGAPTTPPAAIYGPPEPKPAPTLVELEHRGGYHAEYHPRLCAECWPDGPPALTAPVAPAESSRPPAAHRRRGEGMEPLEAGLRRYVSRIKLDQPPEPPRDPNAADDGGPVCATCASRRWLRPDVPTDHPAFGRLVECPDCAGFTQSRRWERFWRKVPADVREATLETYPTPTPEQRQALAAARKWLAATTSYWLLLWGATGRGKTGLAVALARELGRGADFVKVPDLLRTISSTYDRDARERDKLRELDVLERLWTVPVLVLDEFGVEAPTAWAEERIYQVVDGRATDPELVTIITSNLAPESLERRLAKADPENGERVMSRIYGRAGAFIVRVGGCDLRLRPVGRPANG